MSSFVPVNPGFAEELRAGFALQTVMVTLGASLVRVEPGLVAISMPFRQDLLQQHGYLHAGILTTLVDSACGFAAYTLMPAGSGVLTVEYKVNFLRPAGGGQVLAVGEVVRPGRTITVCRGQVLAGQEGEEQVVALMQATMIAVPPLPGQEP